MQSPMSSCSSCKGVMDSISCVGLVGVNIFISPPSSFTPPHTSSMWGGSKQALADLDAGSEENTLDLESNFFNIARIFIKSKKFVLPYFLLKWTTLAKILDAPEAVQAGRLWWVQARPGILQIAAPTQYLCCAAPPLPVCPCLVKCQN